MVLHRGGPVDVTYRMGGKAIDQHIPKGGIFFLPASHDCEVSLHSALDTIHIYLRADLFTEQDNTQFGRAASLAPIFGQRDPVLEHLGQAIGNVIGENIQGSSLFVDPIARAIANRFIVLNYHDQPADRARRPSQLTGRQLRSVRDFVKFETGDGYQAERDGGRLRPLHRIFRAPVQGDIAGLALSVCAEPPGRTRQDPARRKQAEPCGHCTSMRFLPSGAHDAHVPALHRRDPGPVPARARSSAAESAAAHYCPVLCRNAPVSCRPFPRSSNSLYPR